MGINKILVTGASGYLGSGICRYLSEKGFQVSALCFPEKPADLKWVSGIYQVMVGDLTEKTTLELLSTQEYDAIIHLVSLDAYNSQQSWEKCMKVNVNCTSDLLSIFSNKNTLKFIYFSTVHVYGRLTKGLYNECSQINPVTHYAQSHYLSENICSYFNRVSPINCITLRLTNSFGNPEIYNESCWKLLMNDLCYSVCNQKEIRINSDGKAVRDFIYKNDIYKALELLLQRPKETLHESVFNLSSANSISVIDAAILVKQIYHRKTGVEVPVYLQDKLLNDPPLSSNPGLKIDNSKIIELGFEINYSLESGISEFMDILMKK